MLPLVATRAFLHSIMPAPVISRSCFTNCALISAITILIQAHSAADADHPAPERAALYTRKATKPHLPGRLIVYCQFRLVFANRCDCFFTSLAARSLTRRRFGLDTSGQALRHQLLGVFRIHVLCVLFGGVLARGLIIAHDLFGSKLLLGSK